MKLFNLALEEDLVIGKPEAKNEETEVILYSKMGNKDGLNKCVKKEYHEQVQGSFSKGDRCRVRKVVLDKDTINHYFTFKVKTGEKEGIEANTEHTTEVDESFFEGFKKVAETFVKKMRYVFNSTNVEMVIDDNGTDKTITIPNIEYEVDVFTKADGTESEWCKIDIEVDSILEFLSEEHPDLSDISLKIKVSHLPFQPTDTIISSNATEEQKKLIDYLWKNEYNHIL